MAKSIKLPTNFSLPAAHHFAHALDVALNFRSVEMHNKQKPERDRYEMSERSIRNALRGKGSNKSHAAAVTRIVDRIVAAGLVIPRPGHEEPPLFGFESAAVQSLSFLDDMGKALLAAGIKQLSPKALEGIFRVFVPMLAPVYALALIDRDNAGQVVPECWSQKDGSRLLLKALYDTSKEHYRRDAKIRRKQKLRTEPRVSYGELAEKAGVSRGAVEKWGSAGVRPTSETISTIAEYYAKYLKVDAQRLKRAILIEYVFHALAEQVADRLGWEKATALGEQLIHFARVFKTHLAAKIAKNPSDPYPTPWLDGKARWDAFTEMIQSTEDPKWKKDLEYCRKSLHFIRVLEYIFPDQGPFPGWQRSLVQIIGHHALKQDEFDLKAVSANLPLLGIENLPGLQQAHLQKYLDIVRNLKSSN